MEKFTKHGWIDLYDNEEEWDKRLLQKDKPGEFEEIPGGCDF